MPTYEPGNTSWVNGVHPSSFASNLSRTATSAANLFTLPPKSRIKQITIIGPVSNAGGTARISLGSSGGASNELLASFNVKTNGRVSYPSSFDSEWAVNDPNPTVVTGIYAEDGAGASAGGPWTVIVDTI